MSEVEEMMQRAKAIRQRLLCPPNSVKDQGIDLKRKQIPPKAPPPPPEEKIPEVLEHHTPPCNEATITLIETDKPLRIKPILRAVASYYGIAIPQIQGESRQQVYVRPRHVVFYIASRHCGMSIAAIGRRLHRDHTSVLIAIRRMEKRLENDPALASTIQMLENELLAGKYDDPSNFYRATVATQPESDLAQQGQPSLPQP